MIQYREILELHFKKFSQQTISTSVGSSRNTVSEVIKRVEKLGLKSLIDTMNNHHLSTSVVWRLEYFSFFKQQSDNALRAKDVFPYVNLCYS